MLLIIHDPGEIKQPDGNLVIKTYPFTEIYDSAFDFLLRMLRDRMADSFIVKIEEKTSVVLNQNDGKKWLNFIVANIQSPNKLKEYFILEEDMITGVLGYVSEDGISGYFSDYHEDSITDKKKQTKDVMEKIEGHIKKDYYNLGDSIVYHGDPIPCYYPEGTGVSPVLQKTNVTV